VLSILLLGLASTIAHASGTSLSGVWAAEKPIKGLDNSVSMYLLLVKNGATVCGVYYETWNNRYALGGDILIKSELAADGDTIIYDNRLYERKREAYVDYLAIKSAQKNVLTVSVTTEHMEDYLDVRFKRIAKKVPSLASRRNYTHYPVETFERHCPPTHHSTGPARKAAQSGEFKR
jgi:hypothetical protein